ncbi:MAG: hypothetical protein KAT70_00125, partial [Thermoplasmata archaeon]|nr:hypothetical protein [Thermoplasmata archaeon]
NISDAIIDQQQSILSRRYHPAPMERPPSSLYLECPECGEETRHKVHRGRFEGKKKRVLRMVVECSVCGSKREEEMRQEKDREVRLMISDGQSTEHISMWLAENERLVLGDELFMENGLRTIISAIDVGLQRPTSARVADIDTLWVATREDVDVKISIHKGTTTLSKTLVLHYDEELTVGDVVEVDDRMMDIYKIKTTDKILNKGTARADDIVRVYVKRVFKRGK